MAALTSLPHMSVHISDAFAGSRLDQALSLLLPDMGLRGRKRLIASGRVLLDGRLANKGQRVAAGQVLAILPPPQHDLPLSPDLRVLVQNHMYAAICKPAGMHSASLAGTEGAHQSVEALLPSLLPVEDAPPWRLLNRLDFPTSGILLAGRGATAQEQFRNVEDQGLAIKCYLAVLVGFFGQARGEEHLADRALDTADRVRTKVLDDTAAPLRRTVFRSLCHAEANGGQRLTLVEARIKKGARHQIRAHAAHLGHAILGDALYGDAGADAPLHLHHAFFSIPGCKARCLPTWLDLFPGFADAAGALYKV